MCGRYTLFVSGEELADHFDLSEQLDWEPRYNISPGESIPMLGLKPDSEQLGIHKFRWGLVPRWVEDPNEFGGQIINARAETVNEKPSFRESFRDRRGLVPSTGFYEWKQENGHKQPYYISRTDDDPFCFAGLWDRWTSDDDEQRIESCAILTTEAIGPFKEIHHRMPLIVSRDDFDDWLSPDSNEDLKRRLSDRPDPDDWEAVPVDPKVNRADVDNPNCIEPIETE